MSEVRIASPMTPTPMSERVGTDSCWGIAPPNPVVLLRSPPPLRLPDYTRGRDFHLLVAPCPVDPADQRPGRLARTPHPGSVGTGPRIPHRAQGSSRGYREAPRTLERPGTRARGRRSDREHVHRTAHRPRGAPRGGDDLAGGRPLRHRDVPRPGAV